jgi:hypothetical protein
MAMTEATSRSDGLSTTPSAMTRQPSLTTGKKMKLMISAGLRVLANAANCSVHVICNAISKSASTQWQRCRTFEVLWSKQETCTSESPTNAV